MPVNRQAVEPSKRPREAAALVTLVAAVPPIRLQAHLRLACAAMDRVPQEQFADRSNMGGKAGCICRGAMAAPSAQVAGVGRPEFPRVPAAPCSLSPLCENSVCLQPSMMPQRKAPA